MRNVSDILAFFVESCRDMWRIFAVYWKVLLVKGLGATLAMSLIAIGLGLVIGTLWAMVRAGKIKPLKWVADALAEIVFNIPFILQLMMGFYLLSYIMRGSINKFWICVGVLSVYGAVYISDIVKTGMEAADAGVGEAIKNSWPVLVKKFIDIVKETSLASTFYVGELMTVYYTVLGVTYKSLPTLMIIGVIYFVVNFALSKLLKVVERKMKHA